MTDYLIDELAFAALCKGERLLVGQKIVALNPHLGWLKMAQCVLDAARAGPPSPIPHRLKEPLPDPPEAREFLPNRYTRRRRE